MTHFAHDNPAEFPSAFARALDADCYLIPRLAWSKSGDQDGADRALRPQGRLRLRPVARRHRGQRRFARPEATIARYEVIGEKGIWRVLGEFGAVGELLCNVYDREGRIVDHPINQRVMSAPLELLPAPPRSGCSPQAASTSSPPLRARSGFCNPTALVTDEFTAREIGQYFRLIAPEALAQGKKLGGRARTKEAAARHRTVLGLLKTQFFFYYADTVCSRVCADRVV